MKDTISVTTVGGQLISKNGDRIFAVVMDDDGRTGVLARWFSKDTSIGMQIDRAELVVWLKDTLRELQVN